MSRARRADRTDIKRPHEALREVKAGTISYVAGNGVARPVREEPVTILRTPLVASEVRFSRHASLVFILVCEGGYAHARPART